MQAKIHKRRGRKPTVPPDELVRSYSLCMTPEEKRRFDDLGSSAWLRRIINEAWEALKQ